MLTQIRGDIRWQICETLPFAAEAVTSLQFVGKALRHTQMQTTERYAYLHNVSLHALVSQIGKRVKAAGKAPVAK
jgi:hypothetical protein